MTITDPGIYQLTAEEYHADPVEGGSLSSTGARMLTPPRAPARFHYYRSHPRPPKQAFDFGHAVHADVLGVGGEVVVLEFDNYNTKAAQLQRDEAYAAGQVPMLAPEMDRVRAAAQAVRAHPVAGPLFARPGPVEQTLVWRDPITRVMCRAMLDKQIPGARLIVVDLKTGKSAEPGAVSKAIATYGYHQQGDFYLTGAKFLGLHNGVEPAFVLVFVEVLPPHLVTVAQLDPNALLWGHRLNRQAIDIYHHCTTTNRWPSYADDSVVSVDLPYWATRQLEDALARGDFETEGNVA